MATSPVRMAKRHGGILIDKDGVPAPSWKTRARVWIFGMGPELLLGAATEAGTILDGESYRIERYFPAGTEIPKGEADSVQRQASDATEFHIAAEMLDSDIASGIQQTRGRAVFQRPSFWAEPTGDDGKDLFRVVYVMRPLTPVVDALVLRDRMARPSRARLFVAQKSFRMKVMRDKLEGDGR